MPNGHSVLDAAAAGLAAYEARYENDDDASVAMADLLVDEDKVLVAVAFAFYFSDARMTLKKYFSYHALQLPLFPIESLQKE